ncbi:dienelactone hydrolase family protein [Oscillatoria salina]|uniref:dienelactone hydrolase family protein n=1 Tax=Oscillatoria salina TaxID=331517 RepID=UPI0013BC9718|nr:dienelactone hydrolase family protein [Oscillatoria salina]MBZ8181914.1 dienelactone hydrolase family protein [Oscillatoria salina IIICB1]NET91403.1 dienelactone hydrolase family protein [Kamptonema sp. SIO1D9]
MEIKTDWVKVQSGDTEIDAYLAIPSGEGKFPGVVVIQEIFGVNEHIRDVTNRLAKEGYMAIAPAIYHRFAPGFEVGYTAEDLKIGKEYKAMTKAAELLSDVEGAIAYLKTLPQFKQNKVGSIGFCFGGHVTYLAATLPAIQATASFYGAGIATMTPGGGEPTITRTKDITGKIYTFFGNEDASIPKEQVDQIEAELEKHDIPHQVFRYENADHGFFCDRRSSYNETAAADAWQQVLDLFNRELKS